jgi:nitroreductase
MRTILKRRSIRRFAQGPIERDRIDRILESAMAAPSAMNRRPYHFVIITDRTILNGIPDIHPYAATASKAPLAIVVCADTSVQPDPGYYSQDCSAATQNILLEATDMGLGSVWCGIFPRPERIEGFGTMLRLPAGIVPFSLIFVGHPDEEKDPHGGVEGLRVHENVW